MNSAGQKIDENQLPTGSKHVSYSEIACWNECSFKHKLRYIDKIDLSSPSPYAEFGQAVHVAAEHYLKTRTLDTSIASTRIERAWKENDHDDLQRWLEQSTSILVELPAFMDREFPHWEFFSSEERLFESIETQQNVSFKGYIDGVVVVPDKKEQPQRWMIDFKTCSWGWPIEKRRDFMISAQLVLYKNFWAKKHSVDPMSVRCAFVLLKRTGRQNQRCEKLTVSVGPTTSRRALTVVDNMIESVRRGIAIKNRASCARCEYNNTTWCPR